MSDKKWHDNIPVCGVLVKEKFNDIDIVSVLVSVGNITDSANQVVEYFGVNALGDELGCIDNLTPLSAQEWWDFAPWQGMDNPVLANNNFLVMTRHREAVTAYLSKHGVIRREHCGSEILIKDCLRWLPLPGGKL